MVERPRIHTYKARHDWTVDGLPEPGEYGTPMLCRRCGQMPRSLDPDRFKIRHATGCAGRRYRGWLRRGDEVDVHVDGVGMRTEVLSRRSLHHAYVRGLPESGGGRVRVAVTDLRPVFAGPVEAEKRRQAYLARMRETGASDE